MKFSTRTDYVGDLIYKNGILETIWTDEGRIKVDVDTTINSWLDTLTSIVHYDTLINFKSRFQYFIQDHLGNNCVIFEKLNDSLYVAQRMDYYPFGSPFETENLDFRFSYQGKEYIDFLGLNQFDFHSRTYDSYLGRFSQVDGANQFASGYTGMGNNPVSGIDPDGQWVHIAIGAAIGGVINLGYKAYTGQIHSWKDGFAAFGIGAVAGGLGAATGGAAFAAAGGGAAGAGGFLAGAAGGATGAAVSSPIQGLGNAAYFGDPYSAKSLGRDIAFGALTGGIVNGAIAGFNKTPSGAFRNVITGDRVADGASRFGLRNSALLREQGWTKGVGGRWVSTGGGNATSQFPDWVDNLGQVHKGGTYTSQAPSNSITPYYPANNGSLGNWNSTILPPGTIIDRYGSEFGDFFSPSGTPINMRALDYNPSGPVNAYEVLKSLPVQESTIAPAFGKIGLGIQYKTPASASDLVRLKYLKPIR